jgi:hypothetical protein
LAAATATEGLNTSGRRSERTYGWRLNLELAAALLEIGDVVGSAVRTTQVLELAIGEVGKHWKASGLLRAGTILMTAGQAAEAVSAFAAADRLFEESFHAQPWLHAEQERHVVAARDSLGADGFARIWELGKTFEDDEALQKAIGSLGEVITVSESSH